MRPLRGIERRIERVVEGVFGRAFRTHVQPVELARKLAREMDEHRSVSVSRVYVPNEYSLYLSPPDREQFAAYENSLVAELQDYLAEHARRERYALTGTPRVLLETDADLAVGEFGIATRLTDTGDAEASLPQAAADAPSLTMIYRPEEEPTGSGVRPAATLAIDGRVVALSSSHVVVGRARESDVHVDDTNASRRHCTLTHEGPAGWILVDLGSTNGTLLNDARVDRAPLADGDRITVGDTTLVFGRPPG